MTTASELRERAWRALVKELGLADALRYRILFEGGEGDYTHERDALFAGTSMERWLDDIAQWERDHPRSAE